MHRDVNRLESDAFDILVIGGGIHGAAIAWDASLRGLRVALVEQRDFASGTTGNSLRIAHGGLRAIQRLAVGKLRQSAREQAILFHIAPGYVQPLPCLIPIYRGGSTGITAFRAALASSRVLTADIYRQFDTPLPSPRLITPEEVVSCFPGFDVTGLVGGALWYDAQVPEIERLVLAFVSSAVERGAVAANYVRVSRLTIQAGAVTGAHASDQRTGRSFRIRARMVVNAAGPWCREVVEGSRASDAAGLPRRWAQGVNIVVDRPPPPVAIGIRSPWNSDRDPIMGGQRYLFMTGWKGATLAGTSYRFAAETGASLEAQILELLDEWNTACPSLGWDLSEVSHHHCGRLPLRDGLEKGRATALLDHSAIVDHAHTGLGGLVTVVGTKFTTARRTAELVVNGALRSLGMPPQRCVTSRVALHAGSPLSSDLGAGVRKAVQEEMAFSLEDIVVRRLGIGLTKCPPVDVIGQVADLAAAEQGWSARQTDEEIQQLLGRLLPGGVTRAA